MTNPRDRELAQTTELHHGVFDRTLLHRLGFTKRERATRVARGTWVPLHDGVFRLDGAPLDWRSHVYAAVLAGGPGAAGSHRSGAALHDLPGGSRDLQELICRRWRRARHDGLIVHESTVLTAHDVAVVGVIPTTTVDRTLTESEMELRLLQLLRRNGLPEPVTQYEIRVGGRFVARVDAAYVDWKIALEYESVAFHTGREALVRDSARRNQIVAVGWKPIAVTWADVVSGGHQVCAAITAART